MVLRRTALGAHDVRRNSVQLLGSRGEAIRLLEIWGEIGATRGLSRGHVSSFGVSCFENCRMYSVFWNFVNSVSADSSFRYALMLACWQWHAHARPTFSHLVERLYNLLSNLCSDLNYLDLNSQQGVESRSVMAIASNRKQIPVDDVSYFFDNDCSVRTTVAYEQPEYFMKCS